MSNRETDIAVPVHTSRTISWNVRVSQIAIFRANEGTAKHEVRERERGIVRESVLQIQLSMKINVRTSFSATHAKRDCIRRT